MVAGQVDFMKSFNSIKKGGEMESEKRDGSKQKARAMPFGQDKKHRARTRNPTPRNKFHYRTLLA